MTVHPNPRNLVRQMLPKRQPRTKRPKNPGEANTRKLLAARSGGWCERCGIAPAQSVHHRLKRSQGGPWSASNCVHVCGDGVRFCHGFAELNPDAAGDEGLHLRPWMSPADSRFLYRGRWVLLNDDGTVSPVEGGAS
jgi:hypothetical protein